MSTIDETILLDLPIPQAVISALFGVEYDEKYHQQVLDYVVEVYEQIANAAWKTKPPQGERGDYFRESLRDMARGCWPKMDEKEEVWVALAFLVARKKLQETPLENLTSLVSEPLSIREVVKAFFPDSGIGEIVSLMGEGFSMVDTAAKLGHSVRTVWRRLQVARERLSSKR